MSELETLRIENERLYEARDTYKHDYEKSAYEANRWMFRCFVAVRLLTFLNTVNPFWFDEDLEKELNLQAEGVFGRWQKRETFSLEDLKKFGDFMRIWKKERGHE